VKVNPLVPHVGHTLLPQPLLEQSPQSSRQNN
jgi:hypothetical protein